MASNTFTIVETHELPDPPDLTHVVTEDDTPLDNMFQGMQQRLLVEPLYTSWQPPGEERSFLALANVGLFSTEKRPAIVPDVLLSLDLRVHEDIWKKAHRSYFLWVFGKPPDVVVEVVSNDEGNEDTTKLAEYARIGVPYYVIFDPQRILSQDVLRTFELQGGRYRPMPDRWIEHVGLGLCLWEGSHENLQATWLRWCDRDGKPIPTGAERTEQERQRAERLAAKLSELGVDPNGNSSVSENG